MSEVKKFAVFDIDGTIIRWQLYHSVVDHLAKRGLIDTEKFAATKAARMVWKNRVSTTSFRTYEISLVQVFEQALLNLNYDEYINVIEEVFDEYKDQTYTYTRDLIHYLKSKGYLLFAVSGSQIEIVSMLARHFDFDDWDSSTYEVKNGKFTGGKTVLRGKQKPIAIKKLVEKNNASFKGSLAIGDTDSDIPMLEMVERPIAFNPNRELFDHARAHAWPVVIERKNMVYKLELNGKNYHLKN